MHTTDFHQQQGRPDSILYIFRNLFCILLFYILDTNTLHITDTVGSGEKLVCLIFEFSLQDL